jgi:hypothetical protein
MKSIHPTSHGIVGVTLVIESTGLLPTRVMASIKGKTVKGREPYYMEQRRWIFSPAEGDLAIVLGVNDICMIRKSL